MGYGSRALQLLQMYYEGRFPTMEESSQSSRGAITAVSSEVRLGFMVPELQSWMQLDPSSSQEPVGSVCEVLDQSVVSAGLMKILQLLHGAQTFAQQSLVVAAGPPDQIHFLFAPCFLAVLLVVWIVSLLLRPSACWRR